MKTITLIGFMGAGKSYIGKVFAEKNSFKFVDTDEEIRKDYGDIGEIFRRDGEMYFRKIEKAVFEKCIADDTIVSTGGGLPIKHFNRRLLQKTECVFVNTPFDVCYERISVDSTRPLVQKLDMLELEQLYYKRLTTYDKLADFIVDGSLNVNKIVELIEKWYFDRKDVNNG